MIVAVLLVGTLLVIGFTVLAVRSGKAIFSPMIVERDLSRGQVVRLSEGRYALWGKSSVLKSNRLLVENPVLTRADHVKIPIFYSFGGTHKNSLDGNGRGLLFVFSVPSGEYVFDIEDRPFAKYPIPRHLPVAQEKLCSVEYFIAKKASALYNLGFFLGIFGAVAALIATVVLAAFLGAGIL